jgi:hypothetical protein
VLTLSKENEETDSLKGIHEQLARFLGETACGLLLANSQPKVCTGSNQKLTRTRSDFQEESNNDEFLQSFCALWNVGHRDAERGFR